MILASRQVGRHTSSKRDTTAQVNAKLRRADLELGHAFEFGQSPGQTGVTVRHRPESCRQKLPVLCWNCVSALLDCGTIAGCLSGKNRWHPEIERETTIRIKQLGVLAGLLGMAMHVFAILAWRERNSAVTSEVVPSADSMPLTRLVAPGLFDTENAGAMAEKPAELARAAFQRIYIIGYGSLALFLICILLLVVPQGPRTGEYRS